MGAMYGMEHLLPWPEHTEDLRKPQKVKARLISETTTSRVPGIAQHARRATENAISEEEETLP